MAGQLNGGDASTSAINRQRANTEINLDRNLRLQYLAGLQLNSQLGKAMYGPMLAERRWAPELFVGKPATLSLLREKLGL